MSTEVAEDRQREATKAWERWHRSHLASDSAADRTRAVAEALIRAGYRVVLCDPTTGVVPLGIVDAFATESEIARVTSACILRRLGPSAGDEVARYCAQDEPARAAILEEVTAALSAAAAGKVGQRWPRSADDATDDIEMLEAGLEARPDLGLGIHLGQSGAIALLTHGLAGRGSWNDFEERYGEWRSDELGRPPERWRELPSAYLGTMGGKSIRLFRSLPSFVGRSRTTRSLGPGLELLAGDAVLPVPGWISPQVLRPPLPDLPPPSWEWALTGRAQDDADESCDADDTSAVIRDASTEGATKPQRRAKVRDLIDFAALLGPIFPLHNVESSGACSCGAVDCDRGVGKHPRTPRGFKDASRDAAEIEGWDRRYPDANWGLRTGRTPGEARALTVIDIDPRNGGTDSYAALLATSGSPPDTLQTITGGGGRHIWFDSSDVTISSRSNALGSGIDVKSDGGYVVIPPSRHASGEFYQFDTDPRVAPIAPIPSAWKDLLLGARQDCDKIGHSATAVPGRRVPPGERHNALVSLAGTLRQRGCEAETIGAALQSFNRTQCESPLPEAEVDRIASSTARWKAGDATRWGAQKSFSGGPAGILMEDVQPEEVEWLWRGYIPFGKVVVLEGDPGVGKSALALELVSRVSRGDPMPFSKTRTAPAGAVVINAEDGLGDTIRPRLEAANADLSRIVAFRFEELPNIPDDLDRVEEATARMQAKIVIIDPLMALLHGGIDAHRDHHIRRALAPLAGLAERTGAAIVVVRHLTKNPGGKAKYRGGGSIGVIGAARAAFLVAPDPGNSDRKIMAAVKMNLGPEPPSLAYKLVGAKGAVRVEWLGESQLTADELSGAAGPEKPRNPADLFLREALANGPVSVVELERRAMEFGIPKSVLRRARERLGILPRKGGFAGGWQWQLFDGETPF